MAVVAGVVGSCRAGPRVVCSWVSWSLVTGIPLGLSGPTRPLNSDKPARPSWARARMEGSSQTEVWNWRRTALRPVFDEGKWAAMSADPALESVPLGLEL